MEISINMAIWYSNHIFSSPILAHEMWSFVF